MHSLAKDTVLMHSVAIYEFYAWYAKVRVI